MASGNSDGAATPAVVSAEVGAAVMPVVPAPIAIFIVASFAAMVLAVKTIEVPVPPTTKNAVTSTSAASAVRILPAQTDAVSPLVSATVTALGELVIPAAVTVTVALAEF